MPGNKDKQCWSYAVITKLYRKDKSSFSRARLKKADPLMSSYEIKHDDLWYDAREQRQAVLKLRRCHEASTEGQEFSRAGGEGDPSMIIARDKNKMALLNHSLARCMMQSSVNCRTLRSSDITLTLLIDFIWIESRYIAISIERQLDMDSNLNSVRLVPHRTIRWATMTSDSKAYQTITISKVLQHWNIKRYYFTQLMKHALWRKKRSRQSSFAIARILSLKLCIEQTSSTNNKTLHRAGFSQASQLREFLLSDFASNRPSTVLFSISLRFEAHDQVHGFNETTKQDVDWLSKGCQELYESRRSYKATRAENKKGAILSDSLQEQLNLARGGVLNYSLILAFV